MKSIRHTILVFAFALTLASSHTFAAGIDFLDNLDAAQLLARAAHKPIVVEFNASWCGWCRKMESQTFADQRVQEMANTFTWVQIDIDEQPEVAAEFHVRGVPHISVLDHQGIEMTSKSGYMPADELVDLLQEGLNGELERQAVDEDESADISRTISKLVDMLAKPQRGGRDQILASISSLGAQAWPDLLKSLSSDRLAVRAAAIAALAKATGAALPFDPFSDAPKRAEQIAAWEQWIAQHQETKASVES
jgi:thioredoxin-like negative regulator of GroEL